MSELKLSKQGINLIKLYEEMAVAGYERENSTRVKKRTTILN